MKYDDLHFYVNATANVTLRTGFSLTASQRELREGIFDRGKKSSFNNKSPLIVDSL